MQSHPHATVQKRLLNQELTLWRRKERDRERFCSMMKSVGYFKTTSQAIKKYLTIWCNTRKEPPHISKPEAVQTVQENTRGYRYWHLEDTHMQNDISQSSRMRQNDVYCLQSPMKERRTIDKFFAKDNSPENYVYDNTCDREVGESSSH